MSSRDVLCPFRVISESQLNVGATIEVEHCSSKRLTVIPIISNEDITSLVPWHFLIPLNFVLDSSFVEHAVTLINATRYQLVTVCRSIYAEETAQVTGLRLSSFRFIISAHRARCRADLSVTSCFDLWSSCSGNQWYRSRWVPSWPTLSKSAFQVNVQAKKGVGGRGGYPVFFTGTTDEAGKPRHFDRQICRKDVSVLTHGPHEIVRHYQGSKRFPRD